MFIKLIVCQTADPTRFAAGQRVWAELAGKPGFIGQFGGWSIANSHEAVILSLWASADTYLTFMADGHDAMFAASGQADGLKSTHTATFSQEMTIPGQDADLPRLLKRWSLGAHAAAACLRLVESTVHPHARDAFKDTQRNLWNPALKEHGILAGTFAESTTDSLSFLTASLWPTVGEHDDYQRTVLPHLIGEADVISSCRALMGRFAVVDPTWTVVSNA